MILDDELREAIIARSSMAVVKRLAAARGVRTMRRAGLELVAGGVTTLDELDRITFAEHADGC
jgi:general secretion pathway protein E